MAIDGAVRNRPKMARTVAATQPRRRRADNPGMPSFMPARSKLTIGSLETTVQVREIDVRKMYGMARRSGVGSVVGIQ